MSYWASLYARFRFEEPLSESDLKLLNDNRYRGSEGSEEIELEYGETAAYRITTRLRDTEDEDSPAMLAWFTRVCAGWPRAIEGYLEIDIDREREGFASGPRYRFVWQDGKLTKLRGMLDW